MTIFSAGDDSVISNRRRWKYQLTYDDVTDVVTLNVQMTDMEDNPVDPTPGDSGGIIVTLVNGQQRDFDFVALGYVNAGVQSIPNVRVRLTSGGRNTTLAVENYFHPAP